MTQATDEQLWAHAAAGTPEAFGELYERHARAVYNSRRSSYSKRERP